MSWKTRLALAASPVFLSGLIGCSSTVVMRPMEGQILPAPVGSVLTTGEATYEVTEPSYLITQDYVTEIMRVRIGE